MSKLALVECGILETLDGQEVDLNSHQWGDWLERNQSFRYCPKSGNAPYTARKEAQYWYGYRKVSGKLHKRYIGKPEELTICRLEEVSNQLNTTSEPRPKKEAVTEVKTSVTSDELERLHKEIERLQIQINQQNEQLTKASEMNTEYVELKNEHWLQSHSLRLSNEELQKVKADNDRLNRELQKLPNKLQIQVNYNDVRDEYLASLKLGKQSPEYKRTKKHLDGFIAILDKLSVAAQQPQRQTLEPLVDAAFEIYEIGKDSGYLFSMLNKIAMQSGLRLYRGKPAAGKLYSELYFITPYDKSTLKLVESSSINVIAEFLRKQYVKPQPGNKKVTE